MNVEDKLIALLETFKYPVYRQGSLAKDAPYPDTFFTFWELPQDENSYDNETKFVIYNFNVFVYSIDPLLLETLLANARTLLKRNNFIIIVRGFDAASDEISHTGKGFEVAFLNTET